MTDDADIRIGSWTFEPAMALYVLNTGVSVLVAFGLGLDQSQTAAVTTIATAVLGILAATQVRPLPIAAITAAFSTALVAVGAFGYHLSPEHISALVTVVSLVLGLVTRQLVVPKAKLRVAA
jgi:hypothetical protein